MPNTIHYHVRHNAINDMPQPESIGCTTSWDEAFNMLLGDMEFARNGLTCLEDGCECQDCVEYRELDEEIEELSANKENYRNKEVYASAGDYAYVLARTDEDCPDLEEEF